MIVNLEPAKSNEEVFADAVFDLLELGDIIYISNYFFSSNIKQTIKDKKESNYIGKYRIMLQSEYGGIWENIGLKDIVAVEGEKMTEFLSLKVLLELSR